MNKAGILLITLSLAGAFICGYELGKNNQQVKYITKEIQSVKKTAQKRAIIHSRPHISRDVALKLMREGKL